jgi:hypothetical protein
MQQKATVERIRAEVGLKMEELDLLVSHMKPAEELHIAAAFLMRHVRVPHPPLRLVVFLSRNC